ncbi:arginine deiminase [Frankia casuarinae]|uniref:Amidinotransferase n=1 Tax=Frankia casuarinae (strain DSM 45818 / CECT 9043 / HFP020203 / CcI3) TaxID=106370 RepID=Q2JCW6_FRACC|nr:MULTISPECIES: arginine deiminase family protein [Frankia]ABD10876.1 amidinotransferase [Frankia casuarinae]ETA02985.1 arginine deiminase [Frankia sp. CcI6]EYT92846.1 arginine deiminase [Frankia casuarinae]OFB38550.1 amidinotransferase [Frankia sp. CgIM4]OHV57723.1 amidinotransferase [Frankia sp. CgIS1]
MTGSTVLIQNPTVVQPAETSVFLAPRPSYDPVRAAAESAAVRAALADLGARPCAPSEILAALPREVLIELAVRAVSAEDDLRMAAAREALHDWSAPALVPVVLRQPRLLLDPGAARGVIGPDQADESYALRPLAGLMFPRDHYVDLGEAVAVGRLRRRDRARETVVMAAVLRGLRGRSAEVRVPEPLFLEGGDLVSCGDVAVLGTGWRTSPAVWGLLRPHLLASFGHVVRVRDELRRDGQPHLNSWLGLGPGIALVAADRLHAPAVVERDGVAGRETTLVDALRTINLAVCPLAPDMVAAFAAGVFFLPAFAPPESVLRSEPAALVSTASAPWTEPVLSRFGIQTVAVPFDEHHKQFGSLHRALNTVPLR